MMMESRYIPAFFGFDLNIVTVDYIKIESEEYNDENFNVWM